MGGYILICSVSNLFLELGGWRMPFLWTVFWLMVYCSLLFSPSSMFVRLRRCSIVISRGRSMALMRWVETGLWLLHQADERRKSRGVERTLATGRWRIGLIAGSKVESFAMDLAWRHGQADIDNMWLYQDGLGAHVSKQKYTPLDRLGAGGGLVQNESYLEFWNEECPLAYCQVGWSGSGSEIVVSRASR